MNTFTRCQWCPLDQYLSSKYIYAALTLTFGNFYWSGEQSLDSWHDEPSSWVGRYIHQFKNYSHRLHPPTIFGVGCIHQLEFLSRCMHPPTKKIQIFKIPQNFPYCRFQLLIAYWTFVNSSIAQLSCYCKIALNVKVQYLPSQLSQSTFGLWSAPLCRNWQVLTKLTLCQD